MFRFTNFVNKPASIEITVSIDTFKEHMNDMQNLYKLLTKLIGKKTVNIIDNDVELIYPSKQTKKDSLTWILGIVSCPCLRDLATK
jgi:hypothetical protein